MFPIHLILISIIPLLALVSHNISIVSLPDVLIPMIILVGVAIILQIIISSIVKSKVKAALIISWLYVLFFSYGHVHGFLNQIMGSDISEVAVKNRYLMPTWGLFLLLGGFWIFKTTNALKALTRFVNVWSIVMVSISLFNIVFYVLSEKTSHGQELFLDFKIEQETAGVSKTTPDIYYIIFDAYANEHTLKETFGYDNSSFTNFLRKRGFYVASKSRSNYAETSFSLASSLNMDYIDQKLFKSGLITGSNKVQLLKLLEDNKVVHLLKQRGYQFIHFAAGWGATTKNRNADLEIKCDQMSEVISTLVASSMYFPFEKHFKLIGNNRRQKILCTFDRLGKIADLPGPKFIFGDIMVPHFRYDFGPNGEYVEHIDSKEGYINQLIFTNKKIMTMVDKILEKSARPPIIILQSDHGPTFPYFKWVNKKPDSDDQFKKDRMRNLDAYLLPGKEKKLVYQTISPVNTFRIIFNLYFNAKYELLDDKSYFSWYPDKSYHLEEIHPYAKPNLEKSLKDLQPIE